MKLITLICLFVFVQLVVSHSRLDHECIHDHINEESDRYIVDLNNNNEIDRNLQQQ